MSCFPYRSLNCMLKASPDEFAHDNLCADLLAHGAIYFGWENHYDVLSTAASDSESF